MAKLEAHPARDGALHVLLQLTHTLTDDRTLEGALTAVTDAAVELIGADHASIRLLDPSRTRLVSGARSGRGAAERALEFRRGEGVIGWVVEHAESLRIDDVEVDARFKELPGQGFGIRSLLAEPMWSSGEVIGVLSASSPSPGAFDEDDQLLVRLLANCSVSPIERARLRRLATIDDMTWAYNRRFLLPRLVEEFERAKRTGKPVSILLLDLDHFKPVNDMHGHAVGDVALRLFADRVRSVVRKPDVLVRRGGDEFVLIMPEAAEPNATSTALRIQQSLATEPFELAPGLMLRQTASIGVATWDGKESAESLEHRADLAMYEAKRLGRARVLPAPPSEIELDRRK